MRRGFVRRVEPPPGSSVSVADISPTIETNAEEVGQRITRPPEHQERHGFQKHPRSQRLAIFNDLEGEFDREEKAHCTRRTHVAS